MPFVPAQGHDTAAEDLPLCRLIETAHESASPIIPDPRCGQFRHHACWRTHRRPPGSESLNWERMSQRDRSCPQFKLARPVVATPDVGQSSGPMPNQQKRLHLISQRRLTLGDQAVWNGFHRPSAPFHKRRRIGIRAGSGLQSHRGGCLHQENEVGNRP